MSSLPPNSAKDLQTPCQQCGAMMPHEMRFCRLCGYRLGEGLAEYVETVRLNPKIETRTAGANQFPMNAGENIAPQSFSTTQNRPPAAPASSHSAQPQLRRNRGKSGWMAVAVLIGVTALTGSVLQSFKSDDGERHSRPEPRTYLGASDLEDAPGGGAFISAVSPPGGPLDRAGLVGGDVIKEFDAHPIADEDNLTTLLKNTAEAKTATITYLRDNQVLQTTVTTVPKDEFDRLGDAARDRAEGKGYLGISDLDRVQLPGTEIYGVKIGDVLENRPADIAGLHDGDIVKEFDGVPIRTTGELKLRCERALPGSVVTLTILRGSETLAIPVKMGRD